MTKRLTAIDYRNQLKDLKAKEKTLQARIRNRCKEMVQQYPDVSMGVIDYANAPKKEVFTKDYLRNMDRHGMDTIFELMEIIEAHLASQHPHKQLNLYPNESTT